MPDIFISYAREDERAAREIRDSLLSEGLDVWFDKANIEPGADWKYEISQAIKAARIFVLCLSRQSVAKRGFIQAELKRALDVLAQIPEGEVYIVPVRIDDCPVPLSIAHLQYVNLFEDHALNRLASYLKEKLVSTNVVVSASSVGLRFSEIRVDSTDRNWVDQMSLPGITNAERKGIDQTANLRFQQSLKLIEFVHTADLILDVTLLNTTAAPAILTQIGIHVIFAYHVLYCYGFPKPAKIPKSDAYVLELPDLLGELHSENTWEVSPRRLDRYVSLTLPDPVYIPSSGPYRFSIRLKQFANKMPNHSFFRLWVRTDAGETESHVIKTFTW